MDGWLSNWDELRQELLAKGARLRSRSDAELVLRAYEAWGKESPSHLDGDFAFVIWDARRVEAFGARDQIGNKPFYYCSSGAELVFGSELAPVLDALSTPTKPNYGLIAEFLAAEWHSRDETLWSNISRLVAAHSLSVTIDGAKTERYWSPKLDENLFFRTDAEYIDAYRELIFDCTRRASRSHCSVACDVSGGLDSSAIVCVADRLRRDGRLLAPSLEGYTLDFTGHRDADEIAYARSVGQYLGLELFEVEPFLPSLQYFVQRAQAWRDFPGFPNNASDNMYQLMSSNGCRVQLSGLGGDEWSAGTRLYYAEYMANGRWGELRKILKIDLKSGGYKKTLTDFLKYGLLLNLPAELQNALRRTKRSVADFMITLKRQNNPASLYWLSPELLRTMTDRRLRWKAKIDLDKYNAKHRSQLRDLYYPYADHAAEYCDRHASIFAIETRSPMKSRSFVQFAFSTPENLRLRGGVQKFIHRQALQKMMPRAVFERMNKAEFSEIFLVYMKSLRSELTGPMASAHRDWVSEDGISHLCLLCTGEPRHFWPMWVLWGFFGCHALFS